MTARRLCLLTAFVAFLLGLLYVLFIATLDDTTKTLWGFAFGGFTIWSLAAVIL